MDIDAHRHGDNMIDDFETVETLVERMQLALPMRARVGSDVLRTLRQEASDEVTTPHCVVTEVRYAGDEGGIVCSLVFDDNESEKAYFVSITHLMFERRNPLWRDIERYKKRRIERLRRLQRRMV